MYQAFKKITASGFLLILTMPLFFCFAALLKQSILEHAREERLEKESLQTIKIQAQNIYWVKKDKEILVEGKLFDVKSFIQKDDYLLLTGFFDNKEDELVRHIKDFAQEKKGSGSPFSQHAFKFLFTPVYSHQAEMLCERNWLFILQRFHTYSEVIPVAPDHLIIHPPRS